MTAEHWKTAEILDPSWGGAGHVNSIVGETKITPVPGAGRVYGDGFIYRDEVIGTPPDTFYNIGDGRGFSPTVGADRSRISFDVDYDNDNDVAVVRQKPDPRHRWP